MISPEAKSLVEALWHMAQPEQMYEVVQQFLDERHSLCKNHVHLLKDMGCWICRAQGAQADADRWFAAYVELEKSLTKGTEEPILEEEGTYE